ncbi:MAG: chemotaxis protein CheX [Pseudobdellovibrio sp.]
MSVALKVSTIKHPIFEKLIVDHISNGLKDTIAQLGAFNVEFKPHFFSDTWNAPTQISVLMDLKQNEQPVQVRLHFHREPVASILETMLGDKVDPNSSDVIDGVGEICNMIYGLIKTKANTNGFSLGMARPEANFTEKMPTIVNKHQALIIPFCINNFECYFQFIVFE